MKNNKLSLLLFIIVSVFALGGCKSNRNDIENNNFAIESVQFLSQAVDEVTADADRAIPEKNSDESIRQYYILKKELDEIRYKIKSYDDYIENHYSQAALSYTDYKAQEYELEKLENKLESSEDNLKYTFGIHE